MHPQDFDYPDDFESFVPTPALLIKAKLELAKIKKGETLFDLGCGNGALLLEAARVFGARCVGIDIDESLVLQGRALAAKSGLENRIRFDHGNYLDADISAADIVILYLNRRSLGELSLKLERELPAGARIVTHDFDLPGWSATLSQEVLLPDGRTHQVYLYRQA